MKIIRFKIEDRIGDEIRNFCKLNHVSISDYVADAVIEKLNLDKYGDMNMIKKQSETERTKYSVDVKVNNDTVNENNHVEEVKETVTDNDKKQTDSLRDAVIEKEHPKQRRRLLNAK